MSGDVSSRRRWPRSRERRGSSAARLGRGRDDLALVGGAVRDLLLGRAPRELDVVVAGDAASLARELALGASARTPARPARALRHGRRRVGGRTRSTSPSGAPSPIPRRARSPRCARERSRRISRRRDFTVNAIAVPLGGARRGELHARRARARGSRRPAACACCTSAASSTTPRACCAWRATARAWASRPSAHTAELAAAGAGGGRPGDGLARARRRRAAARAGRSRRRGGARRAERAGRAGGAATDGLALRGARSHAGRSRCFRRDGRGRPAADGLSAAAPVGEPGRGPASRRCSSCSTDSSSPPASASG